MGTQRKFEVGMQFGDVYVELLKFTVSEVSKDAYLILPIPDVGLHMSIHSAKSTQLPACAHWKSEKLGLNEEVDASFFTPEHWEQPMLDFAETFRYYEPSGEESIMVFPNFLPDFSNEVASKEKTVVNVGKMMQTICNTTFYQTKAKKLPALIQAMEEKSQHTPNDLDIIAMSRNKVILPLDQETLETFKTTLKTLTSKH